MIIFYFILGTVFASFFCASAYRLIEHYDLKSFLTKSSSCEYCGHKLAWHDLFPIFSFLFLKGRCRYCAAKINMLYPIFELVLGVNFALLYSSGQNFLHYLLSSMLFIVSYFDISYKRRIPKKVLNTFLVIGSLVFIFRILLYQDYYNELSSVIYALFICGILLIINIFKKGFGVADFLVIVMISLFVSQYQILYIFALAVILGALSSIYYIVVSKGWRKKYIPFLPFLYLAYLIVVTLNLW